MSRTSIKFAMGESKFTMKTIISVFILVDIFLLPVVLEYQWFNHFFYLLLYEISIIVGLMVGLRGHGKFKNIMFELQSIARNIELPNGERETRLISAIHHACLELGYIYDQRNKEYGFNFTKKKLRIKNQTKMTNKGGFKMDPVIKKQLGYLLAGIWASFGIFLLAVLVDLDLSPIVIAAIESAWYFIDIFIVAYIHYIFGITEPSEPQPSAPIGEPIMPKKEEKIAFTG